MFIAYFSSRRRDSVVHAIGIVGEQTIDGKKHQSLGPICGATIDYGEYQIEHLCDDNEFDTNIHQLTCKKCLKKLKR